MKNRLISKDCGFVKVDDAWKGNLNIRLLAFLLN